MTFSRRTVLTAAAATWTGATLGKAPIARAAAGTSAPLVMQRLAWAGIRLDLGPVRLFIDAIAPDPDAGQPGPALTAGAGRTFALITHHHGDHCDPKALAPVLGETGYLVCYEETAHYFDTRVTNTQTARMYEPIFLSRGGGEFTAFAVPAEDGLGSPQVSWVIDGGSRRLIHCGDTLWHGHWWDVARAYGPFDVAFLPINGFRQSGGRFTDEGMPMGMTADAAAAAAHVLQAHLAVPIHYGSAGDPHYIESPNPLERFRAVAQTKGISVRVLKPGDEILAP